MKVNVLYPQFNASVNAIRPKKQPSDSQKPTAGPEVGFDRVELSQTAREVQQIKTLTGADTEIRQDKVAAIKKQIEDGTYKVDSEKIAYKMIKDAILHKL